jgi:hypothetical protein
MHQLPWDTVETKMRTVTYMANKTGAAGRATVKYGGTPYEFAVGVETFTAGGQFDPKTKEITIYDGALRDPETAGEVGAHEGQHALFDDVGRRLYDEETGMQASGDWDLLDAYGQLRPDAGVTQAEFDAKYPLYALLDPHRRQSHILIKKDGVSPYSRAYWKAREDGKASYRTAENETLAEIARIRQMGPRENDSPIGKEWSAYYKAMQQAGRLALATAADEPEEQLDADGQLI